MFIFEISIVFGAVWKPVLSDQKKYVNLKFPQHNKIMQYKSQIMYIFVSCFSQYNAPEKLPLKQKLYLFTLSFPYHILHSLKGLSQEN